MRHNTSRTLAILLLCGLPFLAQGKTEISWMQYLHGIHYFKYHGKYNPGNDISWRTGGIFHPITNYRDVPLPTRKTQVWGWATPSAEKTWMPAALTTGDNAGFLETITTAHQTWTLYLSPNKTERDLI